MMERYDYASRTACLRNRIAISYHQKSKHESLPPGCLSWFMLLTPAKRSLILHSSLSYGVYMVYVPPSSSQAHMAIRAI